MKRRKTKSKNYELVKKIAVLGSKADSVAKEINIVKWGVYNPMIDIRRWQNGEPKKGISLSHKEAKKLLEALQKELTETEGITGNANEKG